MLYIALAAIADPLTGWTCCGPLAGLDGATRRIVAASPGAVGFPKNPRSLGTRALVRSAALAWAWGRHMARAVCER